MLSADGSLQIRAYATRSAHHSNRVRSPLRRLPWRPWPHPVQRCMCSPIPLYTHI